VRNLMLSFFGANPRAHYSFQVYLQKSQTGAVFFADLGGRYEVKNPVYEQI